MSTEFQDRPVLDAPPCWPPLAHIIRGRDPKEGTVALCGDKIMGIKLEGVVPKVCETCQEIMKRELSK